MRHGAVLLKRRIAILCPRTITLVIHSPGLTNNAGWPGADPACDYVLRVASPLPGPFPNSRTS
jgi:hypothetical protein